MADEFNALYSNWSNNSETYDCHGMTEGVETLWTGNDALLPEPILSPLCLLPPHEGFQDSFFQYNSAHSPPDFSITFPNTTGHAEPNASMAMSSAMPDSTGIRPIVDTSHLSLSYENVWTPLAGEVSSYRNPERLETNIAPESRTKRQKRVVGGYHCEQSGCKYVCDSAGAMRKHQKRVHVPEAERPFGCDLCPRRFCDRKDLNRHLSGVHADKSGSAVVRVSSATGKRRRLSSPALFASEARGSHDHIVLSVPCEPAIGLDDLSAILANLTLTHTQGRTGQHQPQAVISDPDPKPGSGKYVTLEECDDFVNWARDLFASEVLVLATRLVLERDHRRLEMELSVITARAICYELTGEIQI